MNRWTYIIVLLICCSVFAFGQTRNDTDLSLSDHAREVAERNAQMGFNDTIDRLAPDFVEAYLIVADPGKQLYSVLGHCALRLKCDAFGLDYIFSYEGEDAAQKVLSFLAGHLKMGLYSIPVETYCQFNKEDGRGVYQYKLNLSPETKQELWRILDEEQARGVELDYDYYHRGCANSCVKFVNKALRGKKIEYAPREREQVTGRELVREHTKDALWVRFITCFISGNEVDEPLYGEKQLLIPMDLVKAWQRAEVDGHPLLSSEQEVLVEGKPQTSNGWFTPLVFALLVLLISIANLWWNKPYWDWIMVGAQTAVGLAMTYLLFVSDLCCTDWNWLYIAFNPLPAISWRWRRYWTMPYIGILLIWCVAMLYMLLTNQVLVDWPHVILALSFSIILLKQYILLTKKH